MKEFLSKAVVVYCAAGAVLFGVADFKKATVEHLNLMSQWGDYPALLDKGQAAFNERDLRMAIRYYKLVAGLVPRNDGPYAMVGYCYARLGDDARAIRYFKKAKLIQKTHFWNDYNLAVLYLRDKDRASASRYFHNVVEQDFRLAWEAAVLAPLSRISPQQREFLIAQTMVFTKKIREDSLKMLAGLDVEEGGVILHPWSYYMQPGKENYF